MILRVTPSVRRRLVKSRITAMTRGLEHGLHELQQAQVEAIAPHDQAAIALLKCELLETDMKTEEATQVFEQLVEPLLPQLEHRTAVTIADNKARLLMAARRSLGDFYHLVDSRRILGVKLRDDAARLEAASSAADGKHFDALPVYWQQLLTAYELQNWGAYWVAEGDFCEECIQLGWLERAAYHAILSRNQKAAERSAEALLVCRSSERIAETLNKLLGVSALREHALQTIRIIVKIADAIFERRRPTILERLS